MTESEILEDYRNMMDWAFGKGWQDRSIDATVKQWPERHSKLPVLLSIKPKGGYINMPFYIYQIKLYWDSLKNKKEQIDEEIINNSSKLATNRRSCSVVQLIKSIVWPKE